ncbi:MAG: uroporphyrinogen-III C-methyltransferase [Thiohalobacteraceae bacterium]|nr:uroporphyrinogen-III C-methyltransferase [Gammaproteobacteria bacterium]
MSEEQQNHPPSAPDTGVTPTPPPASTDPSAPPAATTTSRRDYALPLAVLALLSSAGIGVGGYFIGHEVHRLDAVQREVLGRVDDRTQAFDQRLATFTGRLDDELAASERARHTLEGEQRTLAAAQVALEGSLGTLRAQLGRGQSGWVLAEVQYLLRVANQRLQLQRDVGTAVAALSSADQRLQELADPGLNPVREQLAREIAALNAVAQPDIPGIALALDSLATRVATLPLKDTRPSHGAEVETEPGGAAPTANDWRRLPALVWRELKRLVVVRRDATPVAALLAPEQQYFLQQNLRLQLESARLAALQAAPEPYQASLRTARAWLDTYFAGDDPRVTAVLGRLAQLAEIDVRPALPDISASLRQLRQQIRLAELAGGRGRPAAESGPDAAPDAGSDTSSDTGTDAGPGSDADAGTAP